MEGDIALPLFPISGIVGVMERANNIQGDYSFWKAEYRWGGEPYEGVTAQANLTDPNIPPGTAYFNYDGRTMRDNAPLW